jgi:hypothetical protein
MDLRLDEPCYRYLAAPGTSGTCHLRLYWGPGEAVVVATELDGHDGPSVIHSWPALARQIVTTCGVPPEATTWVQHDPPDVALSLEESFSWVMLPWDLSRSRSWTPQWRFATRATLETLIGQPFTEMQPAP